MCSITIGTLHCSDLLSVHTPCSVYNVAVVTMMFRAVHLGFALSMGVSFGTATLLSTHFSRTCTSSLKLCNIFDKSESLTFLAIAIKNFQLQLRQFCDSSRCLFGGRIRFLRSNRFISLQQTIAKPRRSCKIFAIQFRLL